MSTLTAAQRLQQAHATHVVIDQGRIVEDPFPTDPAPGVSASAPTPAPAPSALNLADESAFPSLTGQPAAKPPTWGARTAAATPVRAAAQAGASLTLRLPAADLKRPLSSGTGRNAGPANYAELLRHLAVKFPGVTVETSVSRASPASAGEATLLVRSRGAQAAADVQAAKAELMAHLARKISVEVSVPVRLTRVLIGTRGRTLRGIEEATGTRIQVPRESATESEIGTADSAEDDYSAVVSVTVTGPEEGVAAARERIAAIINERVSKVQRTFTDVPTELWPLLVGAKGANLAAFADATGVSVVQKGGKRTSGAATPTTPELVLSGDREKVQAAVDSLTARIEELKLASKTLTITLSRRQHRLLASSDDILAATGCAVELPGADSHSDSVTIRGPQANLVKALDLAMGKVNAQTVEAAEFTQSSGNIGKEAIVRYARLLSWYAEARSQLSPIAEKHGVQIYTPRAASLSVASPSAPAIEIVGAAEAAAAARLDVLAFLKSHPPTVITTAMIDSLLHASLLASPKTKAELKACEREGVVVLFPARGTSSEVLLVYTGNGEAAPVLAEAEARLAALASAAGTITTRTLNVPAEFHGDITGTGGTTLNAVLGEAKDAVAVEFGTGAAADATSADTVTIRGPASEVARVATEIERIAAQASANAIVNSYATSFEVRSAFLPHIVGKAGAGVNRLRDELGVKIDVSPAGAAATAAVSIRGRQENVEEARRRIEALAARLADEVTLTLKFPASVHRGALIGKQGVYLKRLEDKYAVRIVFPRESESAQEVTIRGSKKNAESAKKELAELVEYERENGHVATFTVSAKALPRILGRGRNGINGIKEEHGLMFADVARGTGDAPATVTLRGPAAGVAAARRELEAISAELAAQVTLSVEIPATLHNALIGSGGSAIKALVGRCLGEDASADDIAAAASSVKFPRAGSGADPNTVQIVAPNAELGDKLAAALKAEAQRLASRVTLGVVVPQPLHANLIGRGASNLRAFERAHNGIRLVMPGWGEYESVGAVANEEDLADGTPETIVKLIGAREDVEKAIAELKAKAAAPAAPGRGPRGRSTESVTLPVRAYYAIAQGGRFFRSLPSGVHVAHDGEKPKGPAKAAAGASTNGVSTNGASTARIDDASSFDAPGGAADDVQFSLLTLSEAFPGDAYAGDMTWTVESDRGREAAGATVLQDLKAIAARLEKATHLAWVTVPRPSMKRVVGRGGAGLDQLRALDLDVQVVGARDSNVLTLIGDEAAIEEAREIIEDAAAR